ncbi:hypothetical protein BELL_0110g00110 [Botrytis elliptica]|uniref:Uncharacterized protein n=1 Tax=Botrytis elliptica TaxID=278938 RepID=A0A4Z1JUV7_9HELO|nr:hypothetical protein BELL_0110g00110 [Botrytis elliptica]
MHRDVSRRLLHGKTPDPHTKNVNSIQGILPPKLMTIQFHIPSPSVAQYSVPKNQNFAILPLVKRSVKEIRQHAKYTDSFPMKLVID